MDIFIPAPVDSYLIDNVLFVAIQRLYKLEQDSFVLKTDSSTTCFRQI